METLSIDCSPPSVRPRPVEMQEPTKSSRANLAEAVDVEGERGPDELAFCFRLPRNVDKNRFSSSYERFLFLRFLKHVACLSVKVAVVVAPLYDIFQPCLFASYPPFWRCGLRTAVVIEQKGIVLRSTKWLQVIFIFTDTEQRFTLALVQVVGG